MRCFGDCLNGISIALVIHSLDRIFTDQTNYADYGNSIRIYYRLHYSFSWSLLVQSFEGSLWD